MSTSVEQIKARLGIEDVVSSYMKLEKAGKNLKGRCPFHNEKTPSFYVTPERGTFYCFGCGAKGDIFSFVEQFEGLDFIGSLKVLAERAGVEIVQERPKDGKSGAEVRSEKERLYQIMEEATRFYESALQTGAGNAGAGSVVVNPVIAGNTSYSMAATVAREYVKKRGITDETAKLFRIGFIPDEWRMMYNYLRELRFTDSEIEKAGLAKRPEAGEVASGSSDAAGARGTQMKNLYDRFRDRIMFPIMDSSGRVIAFSGRILHDDGKAAKYLNSPDTPLYTKSTVLYGIDKAKQAIRERGYTIMVEGQMDLVLSHQAGIRNTVAVSGTALSDRTTIDRPATPGEASREGVVNNLGVVRRLSPNIILAFDSDAAGRKAAMRSATIALSLGMDVKIADLVGGKDPADLVLADPESWKQVLRNAKPIVEFQLDHVMLDATEQKLDSRKVPALIRERVLPFIVSVNGAMERAHFVKMIHERTGLTEDAIRADLRTVEQKMAADARLGGASSAQSNAQVANQNSGQNATKGGIVSGTATISRLDKITRQLFGIIAYIDRNGMLDAAGIRASVKAIAGEERYNNLIRESEPFQNELILEAEILFSNGHNGSQKYTLEEIVKKQIDELLVNFEEDIIKQDLTSAMNELSRLEKHKDATQSDIAQQRMETLMKMCHQFALRLSEIAKKRVE